MKFVHQIATYLYLRKEEKGQPNTPALRYMHGINRVSLLLFVFSLLVIVARMLVRGFIQ